MQDSTYVLEDLVTRKEHRFSASKMTPFLFDPLVVNPHDVARHHLESASFVDTLSTPVIYAVNYTLVIRSQLTLISCGPVILFNKKKSKIFYLWSHR